MAYPMKGNKMAKKNDFRNQGYVTELVANAITKSSDAEQAVKLALANCVKMAADSNLGRFNSLNELWNGVPNGMRESIRLWFVNLLNVTGVEVIAENGNSRRVSFYRFTKEKLWHHPETKTDETRAHRAKIEAMSVEELMEIPLGPVKRETTDRKTEKDFEGFEKAISRTIKSFFEAGAISETTVARFNSLLSEASHVNPSSIRDEQQKRLEQAEKQAERLRKSLQTLPPAQNGNHAEMPEPVVTH